MDYPISLRSVKRSVTRPALNVIFLLDISGSMRGDGRIHSLNNLMKELPLYLKREADERKLKMIMRAITFGSEAQYVVGSAEAGVEVGEDYFWQPLECDRRTATASAIKLCCQCLEYQNLGHRSRSPIIFLITDGKCTQSDEEMDAAIDELSQRLNGRAVRVAIGMGDDYSMEELKRFASYGSKPNAQNRYINDYYIYNVGQKEDLMSIIADLTSTVAAGSAASVII